MSTPVKIDNRRVAVAARLARFAAHMGQPATACPYHGDSDEGSVLRRVWLAAYLRINPPAADSDPAGRTVKASGMEQDANVFRRQADLDWGLFDGNTESDERSSLPDQQLDLSKLGA